jgi:hypothetical protein
VAAFRIDFLNSVNFSVLSLRDDDQCMKYELQKVKFHSDDADEALLAAPQVPHRAPVLSDTTVVRDEVGNLLVLICRVIASRRARSWKFFSICD